MPAERFFDNVVQIPALAMPFGYPPITFKGHGRGFPELFFQKRAVGEITESGGEGINSEELVPELTKIRKDDDIKAVVFRVNSPGGSAYASEQIWAELEAIQAAGKKIIVSTALRLFVGL